MKQNYSILINTCDKFEDCWNPFFKLWSIYWPDYQGKIYLNTEYKDYSYPGLNIIPLKVCEKNNIPKTQRATWSQCLKWALEEIETDIILYLQEDYFFNDKIQTKWVNHFADFMNINKQIKCIQLSHAGIPANKKSEIDMLYTSNPRYFSYVSCQASLWQKKILKSLIRVHETAWNFEWWGSKRAKYMNYVFYVVDPKIFIPQKNSIFPYILTGVIGGKWNKSVVKLFKEHNINLDYSIRGFYEKELHPSLKKRIKVKRSIWKYKSIIEIFKLKYFH